MKVQLLPSTIDEDGKASARQHLLTMIIDDRVAIDAGCLALSCTDLQREQVRDIVLTHPHLDHVAGLPLFVDDLFATLREPICIHATEEIIGILEQDLFNWSIYPRFSELANDYGKVLEYRAFERDGSFEVAHLNLTSVAVNHKVSANGYIISDGKVSIAITGDTAETDEIWSVCNTIPDLKALFVECAFPDELEDLAITSHHLTPKRLKEQLANLTGRNYPAYIINIKPMYRKEVIAQVEALGLDRIEILDIGTVYEF